MKKITATELARNLSQVLDRLAVDGEEILIQRNNREIARFIPGTGHQTALEAFGDLYRTLSQEAAEGWESDIRESGFKGTKVGESERNPWDS